MFFRGSKLSKLLEIGAVKGKHRILPSGKSKVFLPQISVGALIMCRLRDSLDLAKFQGIDGKAMPLGNCKEKQGFFLQNGGGFGIPRQIYYGGTVNGLTIFGKNSFRPMRFFKIRF
jgi:hypothetical protein